MFDLLPAVVRSALALAFVLGVLVFIHEMGHYLAARWRRVHVDAFSIGFGKPFFRWTDSRGTEWRLAWIPLGGYVKLHGQETPEDVSEEVRAGWRAGHTFHEKSVASRAIIVAAGPVANFLLAILLFAGLILALGRPMADNTTRIGAVAVGSPASVIGLRPGDEITAIDGQAVTRFEELQRAIQAAPGRPLELRVARDGIELTLRPTPEVRETPTGPVGRLGIGNSVTREPVGPLDALVFGAEQTANVSWQTLVGVGEMIVGQRSARELGGPIRIAEISAEAASLGIATLVNLMALLSVSLGLLNLFPIPMLDGGHLVFYFLEAIRGRPLPPRAQEYGFRAGFAVLITLFLFASWNDVVHGSIGRWVVSLIG
jgi:regulator of sigma E protease